MSNLCEYIRQQAIRSVFNMKTMQTVWPAWQEKIREILGTPPYNASKIISLGDHLYDIFKTTGGNGRSQGEVSGGGAAWEGLVCWYLNLCLMGSRAVVIKQSRSIVPNPIAHATTVKHGNFKSNTESDLIGIIFPEREEYFCALDKLVGHTTKAGVQAYVKGKLNFKPFLDDLVERDFTAIEAMIIQCKTNWNDNAQIPMLWDMIYRTKEFVETGIVVGDNNYSIRNLKSFKYSFVTVPSNKLNTFTALSTSVQRVRNISGGNYWGRPSRLSIAESVSEIFGRNFHSASSNQGLRSDLTKYLDESPGYISLFQV